MENIFFFQTKQIHDNTNLFHQFKKQKIFYSYFQVDQNYYLFFYAQESIDTHFLYQSVQVIEELDSKQRKIRSFRGFFLYALQILENGKDYEILHTNLQPFFWRKVKNIIRQNKKGALLEFLFGGEVTRMGSANGIGDSFKSPSPGLDAKIQTLQKSYDGLRSQVDSLQQKIIQLETLRNKSSQGTSFRKLENPKYALTDTLHPSRHMKITQQGDSTLNSNMGSVRKKSFQKNDTNLHQAQEASLNSFSEASKIDFKDSDTTQQYNLSLSTEKGPNQHNFITLSNISEQQRTEIIQTGFQLNQQGKISLKKYYESTDSYSLFQLKRYSIKYESVRRTKLYQQLKS